MQWTSKDIKLGLKVKGKGNTSEYLVSQLWFHSDLYMLLNLGDSIAFMTHLSAGEMASLLNQGHMQLVSYTCQTSVQSHLDL